MMGIDSKDDETVSDDKDLEELNEEHGELNIDEVDHAGGVPYPVGSFDENITNAVIITLESVFLTPTAVQPDSE